MRHTMRSVMPEGVLLMIDAVRQTAVSLHTPLYLVGGVVRDLHLGKMSTDLDFVAVGSGIRLGRAVVERLGGEIVEHAAFGTAVWHLTPAVWAALYQAFDKRADFYPDITTIDFVTARRERYDAPAALPIVSPSSIEDDLARRDFTINTMALRLDGSQWGWLIDPFDGLDDLLNARCIRILHDKSFVDDPTRMFRAVRYASRLGLTLTKPTAAALLAALPHIADTTGVRIWHEMEWGFRESNPGPFMERLNQLDILPHIAPGLTWLPKTAAAFQRATAQLANHSTVQPPNYPTLYLIIWLVTLPKPVQDAVFARLMFPNQLVAQIEAASTTYAALGALPSDAPASHVVPYLERLTPEARFALRCLLTRPHHTKWLTRYEESWQHLKPSIDGDTLKQLGLRPGPQFGIILTALKAAWLDGKITDVESERRFLQQILR